MLRPEHEVDCDITPYWDPLHEELQDGQGRTPQLHTNAKGARGHVLCTEV